MLSLFSKKRISKGTMPLVRANDALTRMPVMTLGNAIGVCVSGTSHFNSSGWRGTVAGRRAGRDNMSRGCLKRCHML
jgi:hypothetical protein